jgi:SEC-C motif domain protein
VETCFCGSDQLYAACCGLYHAGEFPPTPETLMRARYSAYAFGKIDCNYSPHC